MSGCQELARCPVSRAMSVARRRGGLVLRVAAGRRWAHLGDMLADRGAGPGTDPDPAVEVVRPQGSELRGHLHRGGSGQVSGGSTVPGQRTPGSPGQGRGRVRSGQVSRDGAVS